MEPPDAQVLPGAGARARVELWPWAFRFSRQPRFAGAEQAMFDVWMTGVLGHAVTRDYRLHFQRRASRETWPRRGAMIVALLNAATGWQLGLSSPPAVARPPRCPRGSPPPPRRRRMRPRCHRPALGGAVERGAERRAAGAGRRDRRGAGGAARGGVRGVGTSPKQYAKTFYMGTKFFSPEKQRAVCAVYAWCRRTDDIVDKPRKDMSSLRTELADWRRRTQGRGRGSRTT